MFARHRRELLLAGLLAAGLSAPASASDLATTQQTALGQGVTEVAGLEAAPAVARQAYVAETNGRPVAGNPARPVRSYTHSRQPARYSDVAAPRPCAHLGCRGVHVLGVGF